METKTIGIYKITSPSKKIYIGQSIDVYKRWTWYRKLRCKAQRHLHSSLKKYGAEKHNFEILVQCNQTELNELEKYYVDLYQTFNSDFGLNLKDGGGANGRHSEESKLKMSLWQKGKKRKPLSAEHKLKIILSNTGQIRTAESKLKMSVARKMRVTTDKTRLKLSIARKGEKNPFFGKTHTTETILKLSLLNKGRVITAETRLKLSLAGKRRYAYRNSI